MSTAYPGVNRSKDLWVAECFRGKRLGSKEKSIIRISSGDWKRAFAGKLPNNGSYLLQWPKLLASIMRENERPLDSLIFYKTGPMSFQEKKIPPSIQEEILKAATSCTWLGRWKLLIITDKNQQVKVVKAWQEDLKRIGRLKDVDWIERWKLAPLFIVFCQPKDFKPFQWVPGEYARIGEIHEIGSAVRSIELKALEYGVGLHVR